jgi:tight adherence protein B
VELQILPLLSFAFFALVLAAGLLLVRDVVLWSRRALAHRSGATAEEVLPRLQVTGPQVGRLGIIGRIDRWFNLLSLELGVGTTPVAIFLAALAVGLALGGALLLWRDQPLLAAAGLVVGMAVALIFFSIRRARRRGQILGQLPDVLELLARAVRAGESVDQAIALVGQTPLEPLATEFRRCARQIDMGLSVGAAMAALAQRVPLMEMRILAATFRVERRSGGNLPGILERLARVIRDRVSYHRQFRAATAAGRASTYVIGTAGPLVVMYLVIWQRDYVGRFLESPQGTTLLGVAIALQIVGLAWILGLLRTKY